MGYFLYGIYLVVYAVLVRFSIKKWHPKYSQASLWGLLIIAGLMYDNIVIIAGELIGYGSTLETLSFGRYMLHVFLTPLLTLVAANIAQRSKLRFAQHKTFFPTMVALTFLLIALGLILENSLQFKEVSELGLIRYKASNATPPIPSIIATTSLIIIGCWIWASKHWPWLAVASIIMFIGSGLSASIAVLGAGFEVQLMVGIIATEHWLRNHNLLPTNTPEMQLPTAQQEHQ